MDVRTLFRGPPPPPCSHRLLVDGNDALAIFRTLVQMLCIGVAVRHGSGNTVDVAALTDADVAELCAYFAAIGITLQVRRGSPFESGRTELAAQTLVLPLPTRVYVRFDYRRPSEPRPLE